MLYLTEKKNGPPIPDEFRGKTFRSYADMATFADVCHLPDGKYWIRNSKGTNLLTAMRELTRKGSQFHVEGRGYV